MDPIGNTDRPQTKAYSARFFPSSFFVLFVISVGVGVFVLVQVARALLTHQQHFTDSFNTFAIFALVPCTTVIFLLLFPLFAYAIGATKIFVSDTGITMKRLDATVSCTWGDILKISDLQGELTAAIVIKTKRGKIIIPENMERLGELLDLIREKLKDRLPDALKPRQEHVVFSLGPFRLSRWK